MEKTGLAVIGSGIIAGKVLREISDLCRVVSVYSTNEESACILAQKYGAGPAVTFEAVLEDPQVECVYVATPHPSHCRYATLALAAGKGVLCEKPAAMNQLQLRQMLAMAEEHNAYFGEIMHFRFSPVMARLGDLLKLRPYGRMRGVYAEIGFDAYALPKRKRLLDIHAGGGALLDIGIYLAALTDLIFGDAGEEAVRLRVKKSGSGVDVEEELYAVIGGVPCAFRCSLRQVLPSSAVLEFERGRVEIPVFFKPRRLVIKEEYGTQTLDLGRFSMRAQFQRAFDDMRCGHRESGPYDHAASLRTVRRLDRIRECGGIHYPPELEKGEEWNGILAGWRGDRDEKN